MSWEQEFVDAFFNASLSSSVSSSEKEKIRRGYWLIMRCQRLYFCVQLLWELFTTLIAYLPASDIIKTMLQSVNARWKKMSESEHECVVLALHRLDRKGDISITLKKERS